MQTNVVVITGPPGAGKSSVADELVSRLDQAVLIRGDDYFEALGRALIPPWQAEAHAQNAEIIEAIGAAVGRLAVTGQIAVVETIVGPWFLNQFMAAVGCPVCYVILRPSRDVAMARARGRRGKALREPGPIADMFESFHDLEEYERLVIDSTSLDVAATVDVVLERMSDPEHRIQPPAG